MFQYKFHHFYVHHRMLNDEKHVLGEFNYETFTGQTTDFLKKYMQNKF